MCLVLELQELCRAGILVPQWANPSTCNPSRGEVEMDKYEVGWPVSSRPMRDPALKIRCLALEQ